ncbi:MAG: molybdenum cofactor guanylyltransferase [Deltaproteobacteria bacterium]|nr:molybdenum cofactor guanylyltransferase [Deltaproteobacteria bacterium]
MTAENPGNDGAATKPAPLSKYGAAILCGGLSRRMGSDKAFLRLADGRYLLSVLADELAALFGRVALITNDPAKFLEVDELSRHRRVGDLYPLIGPAGAILTALSVLPNPAVFVMACDMPRIDPSLIRDMAGLMEERSADIVLPRREGRFEPLFAFYGQNARDPLEATIEAGRLAIREIFPLVNTVYLDLEPAGKTLLANVNTPLEARDNDLTVSLSRGPSGGRSGGRPGGK